MLGICMGWIVGDENVSQFMIACVKVAPFHCLSNASAQRGTHYSVPLI